MAHNQRFTVTKEKRNLKTLLFKIIVHNYYTTISICCGSENVFDISVAGEYKDEAN